MGNASSPNARRSSRIQVKIAVLLTSLEPRIQYSEVCEAVVINAHGCGMRSQRPLQAGIPVQLRTKGGGQTRACIVGSKCIASQQDAWMLGVSFDKPGNFLGLHPCPEDWLQVAASPPGEDPAQLLQPLAAPILPGTDEQRPRVFSHIWTGFERRAGGFKADDQSHKRTGTQPAQGRSTSWNAAADMPVQERLPDTPRDAVGQASEQLSAIVSDLIKPLDTQLTELRQELAQTEQKRVELAASLRQIPSEMEQRLRNDLQKHLEAELSKYAQLLQDRVVAIAHQLEVELREEITDSLRKVSGMIGIARNENLGDNSDRLRQEICAAVRQEREETHVWLTQQADDFRKTIRDAVTEVSGDIERLYRGAARAEKSIQELQHQANKQLQDQARCSAQELQSQLDQASKHAKDLEVRMQLSVAELLRTQVEQSISAVKAELGVVAEEVLGSCRSELSNDLKALAGVLDQQPPAKALPVHGCEDAHSTSHSESS